MPQTITAACNVYQENNAIHGLLEASMQFFDEVFIFHTGPGGKYSTDGTIETVKKWGARLEFGSIDAGFGVVRTEMVRRCRTDWVMILDADERFYPTVPMFDVEGDEHYPVHQNPNLKVIPRGWKDQGEFLRSVMEHPEFDGIRTCRRHWFDHTWKRPTQNWHQIADWQCRILKRTGRTGYNSSVRMHEQVVTENMWQHGASQKDGPYHDHFHLWYKAQEPEQRQEDIRIYDALHHGRPVPTDGVSA